MKKTKPKHVYIFKHLPLRKDYYGVSRYRAQQMLDELVSEPFPKYYREKFGVTYVYRKTGG